MNPKTDKTDEAKQILIELGVPECAKSNIPALTLLALSGVGADGHWTDAKNKHMTIRKGIMDFMSREYGIKYAENTRESVRKDALHHFYAAGIIEKNPDDPQRSTNSSKFCYALRSQALNVIIRYGTRAFRERAEQFRKETGFSQRAQLKRRQRQLLRVEVAPGKHVLLSPGDHNQLQAAVVDEFLPQFTPNGIVLYLGDTESRSLYKDEVGLQSLSVSIDTQKALPDILIYCASINLLCLVEVVINSGVITPTRLVTLETLVQEHIGPKQYVTAFQTIKAFKERVNQIAWGTKVWISEEPDHLIHFNGDALDAGPSNK